MHVKKEFQGTLIYNKLVSGEIYPYKYKFFIISLLNFYKLMINSKL